MKSSQEYNFTTPYELTEIILVLRYQQSVVPPKFFLRKAEALFTVTKQIAGSEDLLRKTQDDPSLDSASAILIEPHAYLLRVLLL